MFKITPYKITIHRKKDFSISNSVATYPWLTLPTASNTGIATRPSEQNENEDWSAGPPPTYLRKFCEYWAHKYNWPERERQMNDLPMFTADVQGLKVHFVWVRRGDEETSTEANPSAEQDPNPPWARQDSENYSTGKDLNPPPLVLLHGWPYTFWSYREVHAGLTQSNETVVGDIIIPSLPGYPFSAAPRSALGPRAIARLMNCLLTEVLGYSRYIVHGGDWGGYVADMLAFEFPEHCVGLHLTMSSVRQHGASPRSGVADENADSEERAFVKREKELWEGESAYALIQATRPNKLAIGLHDSPVGVAAWILEAWHAWSDIRPHNPASRSWTDVYTLDTLIDEIMLYLVSDAFASSIWLYGAAAREGSDTLPEGGFIGVPTAFLKLRDPVFPLPPRTLLERSHRVVRYSEGEAGGHFPMLEVAEVVVSDLVGFLEEGREKSWW